MFNHSLSLIVSFTTPITLTIRLADKLTLTVRFADADFTAVVVSLVHHSMFTQFAFGRWAHC